MRNPDHERTPGGLADKAGKVGMGCAGLFIIFVILGLAGVWDEKTPDPTPAASGALAQTSPSPMPSQQPSPSASTTPVPTKMVENAQDNAESDAKVASEISDYFYENFGTPRYEASWYHVITGFEVHRPTVIAHTDVFPDAEGKNYATHICGAVSLFIFSHEHDNLGLKNVRVTGQKGANLLARNGLTDDCLP